MIFKKILFQLKIIVVLLLFLFSSFSYGGEKKLKIITPVLVEKFLHALNLSLISVIDMGERFINVLETHEVFDGKSLKEREEFSKRLDSLVGDGNCQHRVVINLILHHQYLGNDKKIEALKKVVKNLKSFIAEQLIPALEGRQFSPDFKLVFSPMKELNELIGFRDLIFLGLSSLLQALRWTSEQAGDDQQVRSDIEGLKNYYLANKSIGIKDKDINELPNSFFKEMAVFLKTQINAYTMDFTTQLLGLYRSEISPLAQLVLSDSELINIRKMGRDQLSNQALYFSFELLFEALKRPAPPIVVHSDRDIKSSQAKLKIHELLNWKEIEQSEFPLDKKDYPVPPYNYFNTVVQAIDQRTSSEKLKLMPLERSLLINCCNPNKPTFSIETTSNDGSLRETSQEGKIENRFNDILSIIRSNIARHYQWDKREKEWEFEEELIKRLKLKYPRYQFVLDKQKGHLNVKNLKKFPDPVASQIKKSFNRYLDYKLKLPDPSWPVIRHVSFKFYHQVMPKIELPVSYVDFSAINSYQSIPYNGGALSSVAFYTAVNSLMEAPYLNILKFAPFPSLYDWNYGLTVFSRQFYEIGKFFQTHSKNYTSLLLRGFREKPPPLLLNHLLGLPFSLFSALGSDKLTSLMVEEIPGEFAPFEVVQAIMNTSLNLQHLVYLSRRSEFIDLDFSKHAKLKTIIVAGGIKLSSASFQTLLDNDGAKENLNCLTLSELPEIFDFKKNFPNLQKVTITSGGSNRAN